MAPPANRSGQVASITDVMPPPAEKPRMNTRSGSIEWSVFIFSTIDAIDWFSPWPRTRLVSSPNSPAQLKQVTGLLALFCCG